MNHTDEPGSVRILQKITDFNFSELQKQMFSRDFRLSLAKRSWKHSQGGVEVYCGLQNGGFSKSIGLMK